MTSNKTLLKIFVMFWNTVILISTIGLLFYGHWYALFLMLAFAKVEDE